jgi:transcriptional regulator with PAS, ATPase and Fis domain
MSELDNNSSMINNITDISDSSDEFYNKDREEIIIALEHVLKIQKLVKESQEEIEKEHKQLLEFYSLFKRIINIMPFPIFYISNKNKDIISNNSFKQFYGYSLKEHIDYYKFVENFSDLGLNTFKNKKEIIYNKKIKSYNNDSDVFDILIYPYSFQNELIGHIIVYISILDRTFNNNLIKDIFKKISKK